MQQMIDWIRNIGFWIIRVFRWLCEAKKVWITLFSIVGVFFFWYISAGKWEVCFRLTGLTLELLGIGTIVCGLNDTLKLFERTHLLDIIPKWIKRFPKFEDKNTITAAVNVTCPMPSISAFVTSTPPPNTLIEERIARLEESLNSVHSQIFENQEKIKNLSLALSNERHDRETGDGKSYQKLKEFAVEGLYLEAMGVIWLIFGALFATASTELACLISKILS